MYKRFIFAFWTVVTFAFAPSTSAGSPGEDLLSLLNSNSAETRIHAIKRALKEQVKSKALLNEASKRVSVYLTSPEQSPHDDKEVAEYVRLLQLTDNRTHVKLLDQARESHANAIVRTARKSFKLATSRNEKSKFIRELVSAYEPISHSVKVYAAMLESTSERTRLEGALMLHVSRMAKRDETTENPFGLVLQKHTNQSLAKALQSDSVHDRVAALETIHYIGAKDSELYSKVAEHTLAVIARRATPEGRDRKNPLKFVRTSELSWSAKALSASGDTQYLPIINQILSIEDRTAQFHSSYSKLFITEFSRWYSRLTAVDDYNNYSEKVLHMHMTDMPYLSAKDAGLQYLLSKRYDKDDDVVLLCHEELAIFHPFARNRNAQHIRAGIRMLRIIAESGNIQYLDVMETALQAPSKALRAHAKKNIKVLKKRHKKKSKP